MNLRTAIGDPIEESAAVWEQLLRLAEEGDIRAIKLYYDMLEKKQEPQSTSAETQAIEQMAAIRRAAFGDAAVDAAAQLAAARGMRGQDMTCMSDMHGMPSVLSEDALAWD